MIRAFVAGHRHTALLLLLAALFVRALVPSGYMFVQRDGLPTVVFCNGMTAAHEPAKTMMSMHHPGPDRQAPANKSQNQDVPCAFAGVSASSALAIDAVVPVAAMVFVVSRLAFGEHAEKSVRIAFPHQRPLLRGPPPRP